MINQSKKLLSVSETIEVLLHAMIILFCTCLDYKIFFDCAEKKNTMRSKQPVLQIHHIPKKKEAEILILF